MNVLSGFSVVTLFALALVKVESLNDYPKVIESVCSREEDDGKPGEDIEIYYIKELGRKMKKYISCLEIENIKSKDELADMVFTQKLANERSIERLKDEIISLKMSNEENSKKQLKEEMNFLKEVNENSKRHLKGEISSMKEANERSQQQLMKENSSLKKEIQDSINQLMTQNSFLREVNDKLKEQIEESTIINGPGDKEDKVDIFEATKNGSLKAVVFFVKKDPKNANKLEEGTGDTPLIKASSRGYLNIVRYLISKGAEINIISKKGLTALILAASWGNTPVVRYLVDKGANLNIQDEDKETALFSAVKFNKFDIVKLLVEKGADKTLKNKDDRTPLDLAKFKDLTSIVNILS